MSRPQKLYQNATQIVLIESNKTGILPIKIDLHNCITLGAGKYFFCYMTTVFKLSLTLSRCQKAIKKLNNLVITQLTTSNWPNILSNTWKFNITTDEKMLGKRFETWPANSIYNIRLLYLACTIVS